MSWLPILGLVVGFAIFWIGGPTIVAYKYASYLSLATLAGLDSVFGGIRAGLEGKFHHDIFLSGFLVNTLLAVGLAYMGDRMDVNLFLAATVALGGRIFLNLSLIRRYWLTRAALSKKKDL